MHIRCVVTALCVLIVYISALGGLGDDDMMRPCQVHDMDICSCLILCVCWILNNCSAVSRFNIVLWAVTIHFNPRYCGNIVPLNNYHHHMAHICTIAALFQYADS